jgi:hypothetical protein
MTCRATFSFIKGECVGRVINHDFERSATIAEMKFYLIQTNNACNPDSHAPKPKPTVPHARRNHVSPTEFLMERNCAK